MSDESIPKITVTGSAEKHVIPDQAVLRFSIDSRAEDLDSAVLDNDQKIKSVVEHLVSSNVVSHKIRTDILNIHPLYDDHRRSLPDEPRPELKVKPVGYMVQRGITVTLTNISAFEKIYRGLINRGVNVVSGVSFETSDLKKHRDEARIKAVRAAKEKAEMMAGELGATLSGVHTITEHEHDVGYGMMARQNVMCAPEESGSGGGSIGSGEIVIRATVEVVFRLGSTEMK